VDIGPAELAIVLLIALLIFGGAKLPKLARSMGQATHEFRKGFHLGADDEADDEADGAQTAVPSGSSHASLPEPTGVADAGSTGA
jgi:sec-independent protein translocase protein TatA